MEATVVAVDDATRVVALDRTVFYPGGGGQPHDLGTLTRRMTGSSLGRRVGAQDGWVVWHELGGDEALPHPGDAVQRRARLGAALPPDADAHRLARPLRRGLSRLWRARHRRQHGTGSGADGFRDGVRRVHAGARGRDRTAGQRSPGGGQRGSGAYPSSGRSVPDSGSHSDEDQLAARGDRRGADGGDRRARSAGRWRHPCPKHARGRRTSGRRHPFQGQS